MVDGSHKSDTSEVVVTDCTYEHSVLIDTKELAALRRDATEIERLRRALHEIAEEWAGAECGEPVHAQEAYAIGLAKRMYALAVEGLRPNVEP
jgi:hypothetical protein